MFRNIKKFRFFKFKNLILFILIFSLMLISLLLYLKNQELILQKLILNKNRLIYGTNNITTPTFIIIGNEYIDKKSLVNELNNKWELPHNKSDLVLISNILNKEKLIKRFIITKTSQKLFTISLQEKKIIGLTRIKNSDYLIDEFNNLIKAKITPIFFHLPVFIGKNSNNDANVILRLTRESGIDLNYKSFSLINNRRWNINLNNGVKILLPETNILDTLKLLKKTNIEYSILNGNFVEIDLRVYGKIFLKPKIN